MIELLDFLTIHEFRCYIVSGGGRDFMRTISEECYGIPPEQVIGSAVTLGYREVDGVPHLVHSPKLDLFDDGPAKPIAIWNQIGRRPVIAAGNANGEIPMLAFAGGAHRPALRLLVLHDDAEREFAYTAGAEAALARADTEKWTVVKIKHDWATVFAPAVA
jgi:hypothetical protein